VNRLALTVLLFAAACHPKPDAPQPAAADEARAVAKAVDDTDAARREAAQPVATSASLPAVEPAK